MIHAFLTTTTQLADPVQVTIYGYHDPSTDADGRPLSVPYVIQKLMGMVELNRAAIVSSAYVAPEPVLQALRHAVQRYRVIIGLAGVAFIVR